MCCTEQGLRHDLVSAVTVDNVSGYNDVFIGRVNHWASCC